VAPGISEALVTTAIGLAAAIPAGIGYNSLQTKIRGLTSEIDSFSFDFLNMVQKILNTR
jgi:biopolymer transport protein TolQ